MHFLILQSVSFLLMYKLAREQFETHKLLSRGLWALLWISSPWEAKIGSHVHIRPWDRSTFLDIGSQIAPELVCISNFSIDLKSPEKPCYHAQFDQSRQELSETRCSLSEAFSAISLDFHALKYLPELFSVKLWTKWSQFHLPNVKGNEKKKEKFCISFMND